LPVVERPELRYEDCPSVDAEILIEAPPAVAWRFVSDIDLPARFSSEFLGATWLEGATVPAIGARFVGRNRHPAIGNWETTCTIVDCIPGEVFGWVVGEPERPAARWRFTLQPEPTGTRLRMRMQMGPARSGINLAIDAMPEKESRILHRRLAEHRANMEATLAGIKQFAEA